MAARSPPVARPAARSSGSCRTSCASPAVGALRALHRGLRRHAQPGGHGNRRAAPLGRRNAAPRDTCGSGARRAGGDAATGGRFPPAGRAWRRLRHPSPSLGLGPNPSDTGIGPGSARADSGRHAETSAHLQADPSQADVPADAPTRRTDAAGAAQEAADLPSFVRRAQRAERWRQPRWRAALARPGAARLLGLAARSATPTATWWRRATRSRGAARAVLRTARLPHRVGARHRRPAVESSGLLRVGKSGLYRLSLSLRNRPASRSPCRRST